MNEEPRQVALVFALVGLATVASLYVGYVVGAQETRAAAKRESIEPGLLERVQELEVRSATLAKLRCVSFTTEKLDVQIYPVENLGTKKVVKP